MYDSSNNIARQIITIISDDSLPFPTKYSYCCQTETSSRVVGVVTNTLYP